MKTFLSTLSILLLLVSTNLKAAEDRGVFFTVGEWFLDFSGKSYTKLEKEFERLKKSKKKQLSCTENVDLPFDIKSCEEYGTFTSKVGDEDIGFDVVDILMAGCDGKVKIQKERFGGRGEHGVRESIKPFKSSYNERHRDLQLKVKEKKVVKERSRRRSNREVDIELRKSSKEYFSNVALGKMYKTSFTRSGGTLEKGEYTYQYTVSEKSKGGPLEISMEGDIAQQWNHMNIGEKLEFKLSGTCKTLDELNKLAEINSEEKKKKEIEKELFGEKH